MIEATGPMLLRDAVLQYLNTSLGKRLAHLLCVMKSLPRLVHGSDAGGGAAPTQTCYEPSEPAPGRSAPLPLQMGAGRSRRRPLKTCLMAPGSCCTLSARGFCLA